MAKTKRDKDEVTATLDKCDIATKEENLSDLQRQVIQSDYNISWLARDTANDIFLIGRFLSGDGELPPDAIKIMLSHFGVQIPAVEVGGSPQHGV